MSGAPPPRATRGGAGFGPLPFRVRRASPADVEGVHAVHREAIRALRVAPGAQASLEALQAWEEAFNPDNFPRNVQRMEYWVAELSDGRIAGFVAVDLVTGELDSLYTAPWGREMALGSFLLGFGEGLAMDARLTRLWLDSSTNAVGFYARHGWEEKGREVRVRKGVEIPVIRMEKTLPSR